MANCAVCDGGFVEIPSSEPRFLCKFCNCSVHVDCSRVPAELIGFFATSKNYMYYCDNCVEVGNYNIDVMRRLESMEKVIKCQSIAIEEMKLMLNQPARKNHPTKRLFSEVTKKWSDICETPRSSNSIPRVDSRDNNPRRSAKRRQNC